MRNVRIHLLGMLNADAIDQSGNRSRIVLSRGERTLLALIAIKGETRALSRDFITDVLWPEVAPEKARSRLSTTLLRMRRALNAPEEPDVVVTSDHRIGLARDGRVSADLWEMRSLCRELNRHQISEWPRRDLNRLTAGVESRRGAFLEGIEGEWIEGARRTCAETWESMLELLFRYHQHTRQTDRAIWAAKRLLRQDPYREDIHGALIRLYSETGQHGRAHQQYNTCAALLKTDLGIPPGPEIESALRGAGGSGHNGLSGFDAAIRKEIGELEFAAAAINRHLASLKSRLCKPN